MTSPADINSSAIGFYSSHPLFSWSDKLKFKLRTYFNPGQSAQWFELWQPLSAFEPHYLGYKLEQVHRPHYDRRFSRTEIAQFLVQHETSFRQLFPPSLVQHIHQGEEVRLAEFEDKTGQTAFLSLGYSPQFNKEGSLLLSLHVQGIRVVSLVFSIHAQGLEGGCIYLGCIQSVNLNTREVVKQATKALHGIQPRILLLEVVQMMAEIFNIGRIEGINQDNHPYANTKKEKDIRINLNEIWALVGGQLNANGNVDIPAKLVLKPLEEYKSNKRSEYKQRHLLIENIHSALCASLAI
jgi:uncharacterized protein VirK/YbjX